jgi:hypothetical protein
MKIDDIKSILNMCEQACKKEYVCDLTEDEVCAILIVAGVPYEIVNGKMLFECVSLSKRDGVWMVYTKRN